MSAVRVVSNCWRTSLAAVLIATTGCTPSEDPSDGLVSTRDSVGGVLRITHSGPAPRWTPELVASIGTAEEGPASFGRFRSLLLTGEGGVLVADAGNTIIREFDAQGAWHRDIGRGGAGPAEYREPYSLAWVGDTLAVLDPMNARVGLFAGDGSWRGQWPAPPMGGGTDVRLFPSGDGAVYLMGLDRSGGQLTRLYLGHRPSGVVDTLIDLPRRQGLAGGLDCELPRTGAIMFFEIPFTPRRLQVVGPGGTFVVAETERYTVAWLTPTGDTVRVIQREASPVPITDAEWDDATKEFREAKEKYPDLTCGVATIPRPATKPALKDLFLADDGALWVDRWTTAGVVTEVFDRQGTLLGAFPAIDRNDNVVPSARGRRMAVAATDSAGIPYVRIYELR